MNQNEFITNINELYSNIRTIRETNQKQIDEITPRIQFLEKRLEPYEETVKIRNEIISKLREILKNRNDQINHDEFLKLKQQLRQIDIKLEDLYEYYGEVHTDIFKELFRKKLFRGIERYPFGSNSNQSHIYTSIGKIKDTIKQLNMKLKNIDEVQNKLREIETIEISQSNVFKMGFQGITYHLNQINQKLSEYIKGRTCHLNLKDVNGLELYHLIHCTEDICKYNLNSLIVNFS